MLIIILSCNQRRNIESVASNNIMNSSENINKTETSDENPLNEYFKSQFNNYKLYKLTDTIIYDYDGDGITDRAIFKTIEGKSGIIISNGKSKNDFVVGLGNKFEEMGDDFSWITYWGIVSDTTAFEILFDSTNTMYDSKYKLTNPSIFVRKEEVGGGIITFKDGEFDWVHQSD